MGVQRGGGRGVEICDLLKLFAVLICRMRRESQCGNVQRRFHFPVIARLSP